MITTTVPWIVWARFGQSTLRSSATDSRMKPPRRRDSCSTGRDRGAAGRSRLRHAAARLARRLLAGGAARVAPLPAGLVGHG